MTHLREEFHFAEFLLKYKLHWIDCKVIGPHVNFVSTRTPVLFTLRYHGKNKFIAYINIRFNQNLDEKSYVNAKIEARRIFTRSVSAISVTPSMTS